MSGASTSTTSQDTLSVRFLAEGEQTAASVATYLAAFIAGAERSLDFAIYDFRLSDPLRAVVAGALAERARTGVVIRIAYDAGKPEQPDPLSGVDPAPHGSGAFVQSLGYPFRRIAGLKLMHNKYIVRDAGLPSAAVWAGSSNFTDDSWTLAENNILTLASQALAAYYAQDFADLWNTGDIADTGAFDTDEVELVYGGQPAMAQALFSPGRGPAIDYDVAQIVAAAERRVRVCSMLLNSGALLSALGDVLRRGRAQVSGIYDGTQMQQVLQQWQDVPHNRWKIAAAEDIVREARLVGKPSTPYAPDSRHDFMHDKALVVDDTVITGSYNFSNSAEMNAENILIVDSPALADAYSAYVDHLIAKYRPVSVALVDP